MPSGYTSEIYDGKNPSLREFLLSSIRGMGVLITMRDEGRGAPIPQRFEPSEYEKRHMDEAQTKLDELVAMSREEAQRRMDAERAAAAARLVEARADYSRKARDYDRMIHKVEGWECPEILASFKEFMLKQLNESRDFDCHDPDAPDSYHRRYEAVPESVDAWLEKRIEEAARSFENAAKYWREEQERVAGRNAYLQAFWDSLPADDNETAGV